MRCVLGPRARSSSLSGKCFGYLSLKISKDNRPMLVWNSFVILNIFLRLISAYLWLHSVDIEILIDMPQA
jgi:hypothetical protein